MITKLNYYFAIAVWWCNVNISSAYACAFFYALSKSRCNVFHIRSKPGLLNQGRDDMSDYNLSDIGGGGGIINFFSRRNILITITGTILSIPVVLETYARSGSVHSQFDIFQSQQKDTESSEIWTNGTKDVTIIFHGAGGQDSNTDALLKVLKDRRVDSTSSYIKMVDWSKDSADLLQASVKGCKIGTTLGDAVRNNIENGVRPDVQNIHVIGISVGAFPASAMVQKLDKTLKPSIRRNIYIQLTLLDPFQQKAIIGVNFGRLNFGKGADYAQQYLNTDDPVPSTNDPLPNCATVDITSLRPNDIFGHDWPLIYYTNELNNTYSNHGCVGLVPPEGRQSVGKVMKGLGNDN